MAFQDQELSLKHGGSMSQKQGSWAQRFNMQRTRQLRETFRISLPGKTKHRDEEKPGRGLCFEERLFDLSSAGMTELHEDPPRYSRALPLGYSVTLPTERHSAAAHLASSLALWLTIHLCSWHKLPYTETRDRTPRRCQWPAALSTASGP